MSALKVADFKAERQPPCAPARCVFWSIRSGLHRSEIYPRPRSHHLPCPHRRPVRMGANDHRDRSRGPAGEVRFSSLLPEERSPGRRDARGSVQAVTARAVEYPRRQTRDPVGTDPNSGGRRQARVKPPVSGSHARGAGWPRIGKATQSLAVGAAGGPFLTISIRRRFSLRRPLALLAREAPTASTLRPLPTRRGIAPARPGTAFVPCRAKRPAARRPEKAPIRITRLDCCPTCARLSHREESP